MNVVEQKNKVQIEMQELEAKMLQNKEEEQLLIKEFIKKQGQMELLDGLDIIDLEASKVK
jgi:chromosome condensin MukBEF ATPase and DNA-binding subunit MukB